MSQFTLNETKGRQVENKWKGCSIQQRKEINQRGGLAAPLVPAGFDTRL